MKQLVILGLAVLIAACSSTAPKDVFTGTWSGTVQGLTITTVTSQSGSAVSGTCTASGNSVNLTCTLSGTSNAPTLGFTMDFSDSEVVVFNGNYVTKDSVAGLLTEGTDTLPAFYFKKQ
jgi:hypothetical protein